ncbi:hypothetical protein [Kovacikia minuta]|nr:hypothetical protein [Kovacikia minuta]
MLVTLVQKAVDEAKVTVYTTVSSLEKAAIARQLGADATMI